MTTVIFLSLFTLIMNHIDVDAAGNLIVNSGTTNSRSLLVTGTTNGDIGCQGYVGGNQWHFVSAPVTTQDIGTFTTDVGNNVGVSATGNYGISFYKDDNSQGTRWQYYTVVSLVLGADTAGKFINGKGYSNYRGSDGLNTCKGGMATVGIGVAINILAGSIPGGDTTSHLGSVVGNPYSSFKDANALLSVNISNLDPNYAYLQVWGGSSYREVNFAPDSDYIAPGQGFMVNPADNNVTFTFADSLQSEQKDATATFYKVAEAANVVVEMTNGRSTTKETTLKYFDTTIGLDIGWDAGTYYDTDPTLSIETHLTTNIGINQFI